MDSSLQPHYDIHVGTWTNWSQGRVMGATFTLKNREGALLVAFAALFVTLTTTSIWRICTFLFHCAYSSPRPHDGVHHHRQLILRNSVNPTSGLVNLVRVLLAWRGKAKRSWVRILPLFALTFLLTFVFALAAGFSSRVLVRSDNEALISSSNCGYVPNLDNLSTKDWMSFYPMIAHVVQSCEDYARQCYSSEDLIGVLECSKFVKRTLQSNVDQNPTATCPFPGNICVNNSSNLLLDSGLLDSHKHLGINAPPNERFLYRRVAHCAPLKTEGYKRQYDLPYEYDHSHNESYWGYFYTQPSSANEQGLTYQYANDSLNRNAAISRYSLIPDYNIGYAVATPYQNQFGNGTFIPIPDLQRTDGSTTIFFLSTQEIVFLKQVQDPWYQATTRGAIQYDWTGMDGNTRLYMKDEPASPLGCVEQEQLCNPNLPEERQCSPLGSNLDLFDSIASLWDGRYSAEKQEFIYTAFRFYNIHFHTFLHGLGARMLRSRDSLYSGFQSPLPPNQWQLDVIHWFNIALVSTQGAFLEMAAGPSDSVVVPYFRRPNETATVNGFCKNQKVLSTAYTSFNLFALCSIFIAGILAIIVSYNMELLMRLMEKRFSHITYQRYEWDMNETFQLHRLAHEELGAGPWSGSPHSVPVACQSQKLAILDLDNPKRPKLKAYQAFSKGSSHCSDDDEDNADAIAGERRASRGEYARV